MISRREFLQSAVVAPFAAALHPLIDGVTANPDLPPLDEVASPDIDLSDLSDLEGTLRLIQEAGVL